MIFRLNRRMTDVLVLALGLMAVFPGCQTTGKNGDESKLVPAARIPFRPMVLKVPVRAAAECRYPNLFNGASYAIWGGNETMAAIPDAGYTMKTVPEVPSGDAMMAAGAEAGGEGAALESDVPKTVEPMAVETDETADMGPLPEVRVARAETGPLIITCYLESQFPDMSIAYDAVGLKGIQIHLELPDGTTVLPVQKELDSNLTEELVGALRRFGRKLTLYFPRKTFMVDNPAVTPGAGGIRLVMEGHESQFYFEWPALPETTATVKPSGWQDEALQVTRATFKDVVVRAKRISHEFD